ncbi:MAG: ABC transporter ATP-binding protein [Burkholderiaceae bacterium]|nr:MAG: ABC transporter ATP-binding protein [Burkholderiaceae bacterium]
MKIYRKLWGVLRPVDRKAAVVMCLLLFVGMLLETLGVGVVVPAVALMGTVDFAVTYPFLVPVLEYFGNPSREELVISGMVCLVVVYAVKSMFLAFLAWRQACFVFDLQESLSQQLFAGYLRQEYTFHLQRNSALLIRNVIGQVGDFAHVIQQGLLLATELFVLFGISILLLSVEPLGALLVVFSVGAAGVGFHRSTRGRIVRWGEARQHHEGLRIQHLQQGLGGAKDVILLGREDEFLDQYRKHNAGSARIGRRHTTLQALPRLILELMAVTGLAVLVLVMVLQGKSVETLLPTLGLFAAAAFRLMPSVNRVLAAVQSMRFSMPVVDTLSSELAILDDRKTPESGVVLPFCHQLTLSNISFRYPSAKTAALENVSISISKGSSVGLIGGSGAGKSTVVDVLLGLLTPTQGVVEVDGLDIRQNLRGWQDQIGYVPQSIFLTDDSLRRNVAFGLPDDQINDEAVWSALRAAQLENFVRGLPEGLDTQVGERGVRLSGGQRQRIGIARALYHDPSVLVLDEATSSLDTDTESGVMDAVRLLKGEKTLVIVAHRLSTVENCDYLYRFECGQIVAEGNVKNVLGPVGTVKSN